MLQHARDVEAAGYERHHEWQVDMIALLLAMGADPLRRTGFDNTSPRQMAADTGHWLTLILMDIWVSATQVRNQS